MKKIQAKILEYTAIFEPVREGGYIVSVPVLPGCVTQGETFEEAQEMIKDAIFGCLSVIKEMGEEIPVEKNHVVVTRIAIANPLGSL